MNASARCLRAAIVSCLLVYSMSVAAASAEDALFAGLELKVSDIVTALGTAKPVSVKPVGTTSVVFKMDLEGPIDAAFKPQTKLHPDGYLAEVAAFRVGRALGLDNVAPAVPRTIQLDELRALLSSGYASRWDELAAGMLPSPSGVVSGVAIYWIPDMHELGLDTPEGMQRWIRWLAQDGDLPSREKSRMIASQLSTMICFDYLIGNWDRFSGANAQGDHSERHLFIRDHNVAFFEPLPAVQHKKILGRLKRVQRFSRRFVARLKAFDERALTQALVDAADPAGFRALSAAQIQAVLERRRALLSYIAAIIDHYGEDNVLTFP